jgi:hypothetical protein
MSLNNIQFIKNRGGLGTPLPGRDYISGLAFYSDNIPTGFNVDNIQQLYSLQDAEDKGITNTYSDETRATGGVGFTAGVTASIGDSITIKANEPDGLVTLCTYTATTELASVDYVEAIKLAINDKTSVTGYSATRSGVKLTITVRPGLGIYPNGSAFVSLIESGSGAITGIVGNFADGTVSELGVFHYHISEFFRVQPKGILFVGFFEKVGDTKTYTELKDMQVYANGDIRQCGVYKPHYDFEPNEVITIQGVLNELEAQKQPMSVLFAPSIINFTTSDLPNLSVYSANKVSVVISQDAGNLGKFLFDTQEVTISNIGNALGTVSLSNVHENIGFELESIGFGNGDRYESTSDNLLSALNDRRYIFLRKFPNLVGSYFNDSHTAIALSSDYSYIERNRTIDKAIRGIYLNLLPLLNSPLTLTADGKLSNCTSISINEMIRKGEVSAASVTIDPNQDVITTSEVVVSIELVPIGTARSIVVNIGYTAKLK